MTEGEISVVVAVDPDRFDAATKALSDAGVTVDHQFREIGAIEGRVRQDRIDVLADLDGVLAVEEQRAIQLPPPDSDVQ